MTGRQFVIENLLLLFFSIVFAVVCLATLFSSFFASFFAIIITVVVSFLEAVLAFEILWLYIGEMLLDNTLVARSCTLSKSFVHHDFLSQLIGLGPLFLSKW